jgi:hypothetical protein
MIIIVGAVVGAVVPAGLELVCIVHTQGRDGFCGFRDCDGNVKATGSVVVVMVVVVIVELSVFLQTLLYE